MKITIERISAITLKVTDMATAMKFYTEVLGMELLYGGPCAEFSSLRPPGAEFPILNLQEGYPAHDWGRMIFHVRDVDSTWTYLKDRGFNPDRPQDASWGERYFHMRDPDGNELSFARRFDALTK